MSSAHFWILFVVGWIIHVIAWTLFVLGVVTIYTTSVNLLAGAASYPGVWLNYLAGGASLAIWHTIKTAQFDFSKR